jgi:DNA-directed RNA polymerase specialized sigma24 family protein
MMAPASAPGWPPPPRIGCSVESAFRDALLDGIAGLELSDRTLVRFHYFHGLGTGRLAAMLGEPRAQLVRRLARIRERLLRDTRRGLGARLALHRRALDQLIDRARDRFDLAIARVLRG